MLQFLQQGVSNLSSDHPWRLLSRWHLQQIIRQMKMRSIDQRLPPFTSIEKYQGQGRLLTILYIRLIKRNLRALTLFLQNCSINRIRKLLWQRFTSSSLWDISSLPPTASELFSTCDIDHDQIVVAEAVSNCNHAYWGNNDDPYPIREVLDYFLDTFTWWNTYTHPDHGDIYEIRDRTGHGLRWDISDLTLLECVEPTSDGIRFTPT